MSVIVNKNKEELELSLNNGDKDKFQQCLKEWKFKDEQSLLRFVVSILIESSDKETIGIQRNGTLEKFSPADHLLKDTNGK